MSIDAAFSHFPTLTTARLQLRQIVPADAEAFFAIKSEQFVASTPKLVHPPIHWDLFCQ